MAATSGELSCSSATFPCKYAGTATMEEQARVSVTEERGLLALRYIDRNDS
jgi:hypothetical protein